MASISENLSIIKCKDFVHSSWDSCRGECIASVQGASRGPELEMGYVHPWVWLGWIELRLVRFLCKSGNEKS